MNTPRRAASRVATPGITPTCSDWWQACVSAARAADGESAFAPSNRLIVYLNECLDAGASGGIVLIDPCSASSVAFVAHEMAHAMDLKHSYSNDTTYQNAP